LLNWPAPSTAASTPAANEAGTPIMLPLIRLGVPAVSVAQWYRTYLFPLKK
jgi:hypothetical protein